MNNKKLTASVVGGGAGGMLSLNALNKSDQFDLIAMTDMRPDVCSQKQAAFPGLKTYTDHKQMFADAPTDVVCVSTWPVTHEQVTLEALDLPLKGILVEKPLGHTVASGRRLLDAIKAKGIPVAVPHGLLATETPLDILRRVGQGEIGELKLVEIQCHGWDIINAGIHWVHFFVSLTQGQPMSFVMGQCDSSTRTYRDGMQVETAAVTYAQTTNGIRLVMHTGDHVDISREGKDTLLRLVGTQGQIEFWGWERGFHLLNAQYPEGKMITPEPLPVKGHRYHLENMYRMIESGKTDYTLADHSLLALEICEGAYLSNRHGGMIRFPVDQFVPAPRPKWDPGMPYAGSGGGRDGRTIQ